MIKLEKAKQIDRISDDIKRDNLLRSIKSSGLVLDLIQQIIEDRIRQIESQYKNQLTEPYLLSGSVKSVSELKDLLLLFKETTND